MNVMGLDPSLNSTGFSYRDGTPELTVITGVIDPRPLRGPARVLYARTKFRQLLDKVQPELVVIEGYAMGAKGMVFNLGEMGGMYRLELFDRGIPYLEVPPSNLKLFATGSGGLRGDAKKAAMVNAAASRLGRKLRTDDEADAFHLMRMGLVYLDPRARPRSRRHYENMALVKCELFQR